MNKTTTLGMMMMTALAMGAMTGCAADPASDDANASEANQADEIKGDVLYASATLDVATYPAGGDPACADQFVGTKDPYCGYPHEQGQTSLGWVTKPYRLKNQNTPARLDGFTSLAGKITAVSAKPILLGLASKDGQKMKVRAHRVVAEAIPAKDAKPACKEWSTFFAKQGDGSFLPRIEVVREKLLPELTLASGDDIGDDGLSTPSVCGVTFAVYQQTTALSWSAATGAYEGAMRTPVGKDGKTFGTYVAGSYQVDFVPEQSVSMPLPNAPAGFSIELSHRVGK